MQIAQITNPVLNQPAAETGLTFFQKFLPAAIDLAFVIAGIIFLFMLIIGSIQWIGSGGDKQGLEDARSKITNALIGVVILFALFAIISFVSYFFGNVPLLNPNLTPLTQ